MDPVRIMRLEAVRILRLHTSTQNRYGGPEAGSRMVETSTYGGAADKAACLMKCKSSSRQLPGFGRVAYPLLGEATNRVLRGCKSHGRSVGSGNDQRGEQICGSEQKRMSTASKWMSVQKSLYGFCGNVDPVPYGGRPMFCREATGACTSRIHRGKGPDTQRRTSGDNVGKDHVPAGTDNNLRRLVEPDCIKVDKRIMVRRMSQYERGRAGNAAPGSQKVTHAAEARGGKGTLCT